MFNFVKRFSKVFFVIFVLVLTLSLVACGKKDDGGKPSGDGGNPSGQSGDNDPSGKETKEWTENELFWDADKNGKPDWTEKEITLTYATWQYNNPEAVTIDTLLIDAFMEKYPNIHVEMQIVGEDTEWENNLLALMETEDLPDVFLIRRLENILHYNILADLTAFYDHDEDTEHIFDSVKDLGLYDGKRYCIPTFIYPTIWIVNKDLLASCNIPAPKYDWTWEQMESIAKAVYNARGTEHKVGLYGTDEYYFELPKIMKMATDPEVGSKWYGYGYDGEKFNFKDEAYINAVSKMETGMAEGWLVNSYDEDTLNNYYGSIDDPRYSGQVAIWRQPSWEFKDHADDLLFDWDVYPGPSGVSGGNTDIAGVCSLCENKAAAYQLLKWMSFGEEGMVTRYKLYEQYSEELYVSANNYPYPVVDYGIDGYGVNQIWDNIPYKVSADGYGAVEFVEGLRNGAIKANKEVVGWDAAEDTFKEYIYQIIMEGAQYIALADTIQQAADEQLRLKREAVKEALGK